MEPVSILIGAAGGAALLALHRAEKKRLEVSRAGLLDDAAAALTAPRASRDGAGFPGLEGAWRGMPVAVALEVDTLTVRRLPQLWLKLTLRRPVATGASVGVLVRPGGADYYALTPDFPRALAREPWLPGECLVRGEGAGAEALLSRCRPVMAALLADPRVKEVAVTPRGVRLVRQFAEGRRGEHLILRQPVFDAGPLEPGDLAASLETMAALGAAAGARPQSVAA